MSSDGGSEKLASRTKQYKRGCPACTGCVWSVHSSSIVQHIFYSTCTGFANNAVGGQEKAVIPHSPSRRNRGGSEVSLTTTTPDSQPRTRVLLGVSGMMSFIGMLTPACAAGMLIWHDARIRSGCVTIPGNVRARNEVSTTSCRSRRYTCQCQSAADKVQTSSPVRARSPSGTTQTLKHRLYLCDIIAAAGLFSNSWMVGLQRHVSF